jgi:cytochrome c biogenesis protein CcdA
VEHHALAMATAVWLGVLTSISPCPLATNVAAVSYISRHLVRPRLALLAGLLYTTGRVVAYVALGCAAVWGLASMVAVSSFLQGAFHKLLGPLLIVIGMFLLGLISFPAELLGPSHETLRRLGDRSGPAGAFLLGALFAVSFCPVSAALFFGTLVPLAADRGSPVLLPTLYGIGTGLPVVLFAALLVLGATRLSAAYDRVAVFERWSRRITGTAFIIVGIYETVVGVFLRG